MDENSKLLDDGCLPLQNKQRGRSATCDNYRYDRILPIGIHTETPINMGFPTLNHASSESVLHRPRLLLHIPKGLLSKPMSEFRTAISWLDFRSIVKAESSGDASVHSAPADLPSPGSQCMMPLENQSESGCRHLLCNHGSPVGSPSYPSSGMRLATWAAKTKGGADIVDVTDSKTRSRTFKSAGLSSWASADNILGRAYEPLQYRNWRLYHRSLDDPLHGQSPSERHRSVNTLPSFPQKVDRAPSPALQKRQTAAKKKSLLREDALRRLQEDCTKAYILIRSYNSTDSINSVEASSGSQGSLQGSTDSLPSILQRNTRRNDFSSNPERTERDKKSRSWNSGDLVETRV